MRQPPVPETEQPDPMLQMSTGWLGAGGTTLGAFVIALILGIVLYGLNSPTAPEHTATAPPAAALSKPAQGGQPSTPAQSAPLANESGVKG